MTEVFLLCEVDERINFLHPGTEIELHDKSPGAPSGGAWLPSKIRERFIYMVKGKRMVGYEVNAPWTTSGTTDVFIKEYGKNWKLSGE